MKSKNIILFLILIILTIILCFFPTIKFELLQRSYVFEQKKMKLDLDYFRHETDISKRIANNALNNKYEFQDKKCYFPIIEDSLNNIFMDQDKYLNNTHELYANSLSILFDLSDEYMQTKNSEYNEKGMQIISLWYKYNKRFHKKRTQFSWNDHSTALRVIALLYFLDNQPNINIYKSRETNSILNVSMKYLLNPNNYSFKGNHGIFQDIALLHLISHIKDENARIKLKQIPITRFEVQIETAFSEEGIHLENSPHYHLVVVNLIETFLSLLSENDLNQSTIQIFEKAKKNREIFILQNKTLPEIGDTDKNIIYPDIKSINSSFISPQSGYYMKKKIPKIYFIARTQSPLQNHRHNDASSFILYLNNEKIISETGFLDYSQSDNRKVTKSKYAHNILFADNEDSSSNSIGYFSKYISNTSNIYLSLDVKGITNYKRDFYFNDETNVFIISDHVYSDDPVTQIFHLPNSLSSIEKANSFIKLTTVNDQNYFISCYDNELNLIRGGDKGILSYQAEPYDKLYPSYSVIQKSKNKKALTIAISKDFPVEFVNVTGTEIAYTRNSVSDSIIVNKKYVKMYDKEYLIKGVMNKQFTPMIKKGFWVPERVALKLVIIIMIISSVYYVMIPILIKRIIEQYYRFERYYLLIPFVFLGLLFIFFKIIYIL